MNENLFENEQNHIKWIDTKLQTKENRRTNNCIPFTKNVHKCLAFDSVLKLNSWIECELLNSHDCIKWFEFCIFSKSNTIEYINSHVNEWINSFDIWCECCSIHPNAYDLADRVISSCIHIILGLFIGRPCSYPNVFIHEHTMRLIYESGNWHEID